MSLLYDKLFGNDAYNYTDADGPAGTPVKGLLSGFMSDPRKMNQLAAFGQALAQAGAPSRTGNHWGLALSNALGGANQAGQQFDQNAMEKAMRQLQMQKVQQDVRKSTTINDAIAGAMGQFNAPPSQQTNQPKSSAPSDTSQPAQPSANPNGGMFGMLPMLALAKDDPKAAFDMLAKLQEGVKQDAGAYYTDLRTGLRRFNVDPRVGLGIDAKGASTLMPGFADNQAAIQGAQAAATEGAKAGLDLVSVPQSDGTTRMMPRAQAVATLGGQQPAPTSQAPQIPGMPKGMMEELTRAGIGFTADSAGNFKIVPNTSPKQSETIARGGAQLGVSANPTVQKAGEDLNSDFVKRVLPATMDKGAAAGDMLSMVQASRTALQNLNSKGGWGTEGQAVGANVLVGLGVAPEKAKMFASNAQIFNSQASTRLWQVLNEAKGQQTEGDAARAQKTYAQLGNTPQANKFILDMAEANALRDKMKAEFYRAALPEAQKKGDLQEIEREWAKRQPSIWALGNMSQWDK